MRDFTGEAVSDDEVGAVLDDARFAPSGGNRQPWRVAVVRDLALRRALADLCVPVWSEYVAISNEGHTPFASVGEQREKHNAPRQANPLLDEVEHMPVVLVVAADLGSIAMMDKDLHRAALTGGASVYPFVHAILLAARARGLGGVMTTFLARAEDAARPLLDLPEHWAVASMVFLGRPARRVTKLNRRAVGEFTTVDRFSGPAFAFDPGHA